MKNQKGFTIVELLIGMVILSIVAAALTGFIVSSSKSYAASNTEIVVQQESQLAMNQMSDVIIDTTRSVNYVGYSLDGSVSEQAIKDADFTIDVEDKSLTLFNGEGTVVVDASGNPVLDADGNPEIAKDADGKPLITGGNGNKNYQIYWDKSEEKLFYSEIEISETDFPEGDRVVLAEYVKDFSVDLSQVEEKRVVKISISYEYNNRLYETSNNITIRNKVLVNSVNLAVNRSVELNIRPKENMVVLEPGENYYRFSTPVIDGRNVIDKSVTWSISPEEQSKLTGTDTGFTDTANGIIHISKDEMANSFIVTVTTNAVDSAGNHASADVIVYVKR
ncbi:MAG: prepilin-type N-terminal cleavage/methylation domain-containing protein, partial [Lachnospiraceae bacterium]|nr:prepilin-type N-terminal cleavage/methylation domain-containing protein [Lachnospiraceae bacterium]